MKNKIVLLLVVSLMLISMTVSARISANCEIWYVLKGYRPVCLEERCGVWDNTSLQQVQKQERKCYYTDGSGYFFESRTVREVIDCGCRL
jgi:hypothetical protein